MTLPEWVVITILAIIGTVVWWGVLRFIHIYDDISVALKDIAKSLGLVNGRIGKLETWKDLHDKQDDERHKDIKERILLQ